MWQYPCHAAWPDLALSASLPVSFFENRVPHCKKEAGAVSYRSMLSLRHHKASQGSLGCYFRAFPKTPLTASAGPFRRFLKTIFYWPCRRPQKGSSEAPINKGISINALPNALQKDSGTSFRNLFSCVSNSPFSQVLARPLGRFFDHIFKGASPRLEKGPLILL